MQMEIKKAIVTIFVSEKTDFKTKAVARVQGGFSDSTSGYLSKKTQDTNSERPAYPYDRHSITTAKMRRRPERPLRDAWVKMTGAYILGRPKRPFSFFCKIKDTVFIFKADVFGRQHLCCFSSLKSHTYFRLHFLKHAIHLNKCTVFLPVIKHGKHHQTPGLSEVAEDE